MAEGKVLQTYVVLFRDPMSDHRHSMEFQAEDFAHAEEQAHDAEPGEQIISMELVFENEWDR